MRYTLPLLLKPILFFDQRVVLVCDGNCAKAWGMNSRPKVQLSDDEDDYEFLADGELPDAPIDPGTYEGADAKPIDTGDPDRHNRWCARECERSKMFGPEGSVVDLPDFNQRVANKPKG